MRHFLCRTNVQPCCTGALIRRCTEAGFPHLLSESVSIRPVYDLLSSFSLLAVTTGTAWVLLTVSFMAFGAASFVAVRQQRRTREIDLEYHRLRADFARVNERAASYRGEKTQILRIAMEDLAVPFADLVSEIEQLQTAVNELPGDCGARVQQISELSARMHRAVEALKEIQTLEERSQSIALGPVNVGAVLSEAVAHSRHAADLKQVRLSLPAASNTSIAIADAHVLRKSLENLIGDAIEITPAGGAVSLSLYQTPDRVLITVADEGPGATVTDQAQLLSQSGHSRPPFENAEGNTEGRARLNLAMVHNLIKAMDGWLWSQSEPGGGTTHVVELALPSAPTTAWQATAAGDRRIS